jgi:hypothetical protein
VAIACRGNQKLGLGDIFEVRGKAPGNFPARSSGC